MPPASTARRSDDPHDVTQVGQDGGEVPQPRERVVAIIDRVLDELDLDAEVKISEEDDEILAEIDGEDELGILIGRRGQTLDALQLVCYRAAFRGRTDRKRVTADAARYRERRRALLGYP